MISYTSTSSRRLFQGLPVGLRQAIRYAVSTGKRWKNGLELARWRLKLRSLKPGSTVPCRGYTVRFNDGANFYILYKDIFVHRIYHFGAQRPDPFILDCGSNIGMSILYFKRLYPQARIVGFEPDPEVVPFLQENVVRNGLKEVQLVQAALSRNGAKRTLYSDGKYGSGLSEHLLQGSHQTWRRYDVACVRLRDYLTAPVDFLKMNIEGAELEVLADTEDRLRQVREMVIEYHHLPGLPRSLHEILQILHRQGFDYLINDFDSETNGGVRPPFVLTPESRYFLLIYAKRLD